jgi:signal transduction histidine kinase
MNRTSITIRTAIMVIMTIFVFMTVILGIHVLTVWQQSRSLSPEVRQALATIKDDETLSDSERLALWQGIFTDEDNVEQLITFMRSALRSGLRLPFIALGLAALLGLDIAFGIGVLVRKPIRNVSDAVNRVIQGDLSARAELPAPRFAYQEIRQLVTDFNAMAQSLETMHRNQKNYLADIAHELRTPITILQGQLDAIEYDVVPLTVEEIRNLSRQTQVLARLVKDLRLLSLAEAGQLTLETTATDLGELLHDIALDFEVQANAKAIDITVHTPDTPVILNVDPERMFEVLMNIVSNALRHTPTGGQGKLEASCTVNNIIVNIRDSGRGLSEEALTRVFTRFYREDTSRNRSSGGSGLGLAISKSIVELHGGRITASNHPSGGAIFRIVLPVHQPKRQHVDPSHNNISWPSTPQVT